MRWTGPVLRYQRLLRLDEGEEERSLYRSQEMEQVERRLNPNGVVLRKKEDIERRWSGILYSSVDGMALRDSAKTKGQNSWIGDGTRFVSGRNFVNFMRLRINAMPTRSRLSRGRRRDRTCRAGCGYVETTNHVLQICHRTHGMRIKRHDAVAHYFGRSLAKGGYTVELEPSFQTGAVIRKSDIIATKEDVALVIDAQVMGEQSNLDRAHDKKVAYYGEDQELIGRIRQRYVARSVQFSSATVSWRGIWSAKSSEHLLGLGVVRGTDLKVVSTRALLGGIAAFRFFNKTTAVRGDLRGVVRQRIG